MIGRGRTPWPGYSPRVQDALEQLYLSVCGERPEAVLPLAGDGSRRRMFRVRGPDRTFVGVVGPDPDENRAFLTFTRTFRERGLPVPEVIAEDLAAGAYLVEDLGDEILFRQLVAARAETGENFPPSIEALYLKVLDNLVRFQVEGGAHIDFSEAHPRSEFDRQSILWDLQYFKYDFLKLAFAPFHEGRLEDDFQRFATWLLEDTREYFVYRDFQARNVMVRDGEPWFIDYQGGRRGTLHYDIASLLYDGKAALAPDVRARLLEAYLDRITPLVDLDPDAFRERFRGYVFLRIFQAMGAYGYLGLYQRKSHFVRSIPHALDNLERLLVRGGMPVEMPEVQRVLEYLMTRNDLRRPENEGVAPGLTVRVRSFSYRQGVPEDPGGHGGGFVFDCRAVPNPGRLDALRSLTGLEDSVRGYLEEEPAAARFFEPTRKLVEAQVRRYLEREFDSLLVQYGCTGGQHRSVYFAEKLAADLREHFPEVVVDIAHLERNRWPAGAGGARA